MIEAKRYVETYKRKQDDPNKSLQEVYECVYADFAKKGLYYPGDFGFALDELFSVNIQDALSSDNYLVRMLAILDRRTGERALKKISSSIPELPEWLQYLYKLRIESKKARK